MAILKYESENELYHHGIKGQKWGVRRFQNSNGSYTAAGKRRRRDLIDKVSTKREQRRQSVDRERIKEKRTFNELITDRNPSRRPGAKPNIKKLEKTYVKQDDKEAKLLAKIHAKKKTKRQTKLEQKYLSEGLTQREAELAAYKRMRTEKILIGMGAAAATAATVYAGKRFARTYLDDNIRAGTTFQNLSRNSNRGIDDAFYTTYKRSDKNLYNGFFTDHLRFNEANFGPDRKKYADMLPNERRKAIAQIPVYNTSVKNTRNLKIASMDKGRQTLQELYDNNPDLRKYFVKDSARETLDNVNQFMKNESKYSPRKITMKDYKDFNTNLVKSGTERDKVNKAFYDLLKEQGYDGVRDWNDMGGNSIHAKAPTILFNGKDTLAYDNIKKVTDKERELGMKQRNRQLVRELATDPVLYGLAGTTAGIKALTNRQERKVINNYRKKHPETNLTNKEIARMLELQNFAGRKKKR